MSLVWWSVSYEMGCS